MKLKPFVYLTVAIGVYFSVLALSTSTGNVREYDQHMCAVYGLNPDCKTPLLTR